MGQSAQFQRSQLIQRTVQCRQFRRIRQIQRFQAALGTVEHLQMRKRSNREFLQCAVAGAAEFLQQTVLRQYQRGEIITGTVQRFQLRKRCQIQLPQIVGGAVQRFQPDKILDSGQIPDRLSADEHFCYGKQFPAGKTAVSIGVQFLYIAAECTVRKMYCINRQQRFLWL